MLFKKMIIITSLLAATSPTWGQAVPDHITVAGGLNPIPLLVKAGEHLVAKMPQYKPPQVLWNDTSVGFELFCTGAGVDTPSINTGTREMKPAEKALCQKNGVNDIVKFELGHNALVAAHEPGNTLDRLTRKELFLAIAKEVPDPKDKAKLIPNPYRTWKDINPSLPDTKIHVLAPQPQVGLYQTFLTGIVLVECRQIDTFKALETSDPKQFESACKNTRKDAAYTEYEQTPLAIKTLKENPNSIGIVSLTLSAKAGLKNIALDDLEPNPIAISRNWYDLAFPMLVFVKKSHVGVIPGLKEFLDELTSEEAMSETGYFYDMGLIPTPKTERKALRADVQALKTMAN